MKRLLPKLNIWHPAKNPPARIEVTAIDANRGEVPVPHAVAKSESGLSTSIGTTIFNRQAESIRGDCQPSENVSTRHTMSPNRKVSKLGKLAVHYPNYQGVCAECVQGFPVRQSLQQSGRADHAKRKTVYRKRQQLRTTQELNSEQGQPAEGSELVQHIWPKRGPFGSEDNRLETTKFRRIVAFGSNPTDNPVIRIQLKSCDSAPPSVFSPQ